MKAQGEANPQSELMLARLVRQEYRASAHLTDRRIRIERYRFDNLEDPAFMSITQQARMIALDREALERGLVD